MNENAGSVRVDVDAAATAHATCTTESRIHAASTATTSAAIGATSSASSAGC